MSSCQTVSFSDYIRGFEELRRDFESLEKAPDARYGNLQKRIVPPEAVRTHITGAIQCASRKDKDLEIFATALKTELVALRTAIVGAVGLIKFINQSLDKLPNLQNIQPTIPIDIEDIVKYNNDKNALFFSTQRFCTHDGPGIRTVVFFKGCNLNCEWCHNPEGKSKKVGLDFKPERCTSLEYAQNYVDACPREAISIGKNGKMEFDRTHCNTCGACTQVGDAFQWAGTRKSIEALFNELLEDKEYFDATGGGITLSGGEPLLQWKAATKLLQSCQENNIHTTLETAGIAPQEAFDSVLPFVDLIYFDLKGTGPNLRSIVGMNSHSAIQEVARTLVDAGKTVEFRMVIVPGKNDSQDSLKGIAEFLSSLNVPRLTLLKYTPGGEQKIEGLDTKQRTLGICEEDSKKAIREATHFFTELGIEVLRNDGEDEDRHPAIEVTPRVAELRETVRRFPYSICLERDTLLTEYCRENPKRPGISEVRRRAGAIAHVLERKSAKINDSELLVGNYTSKRVGGHIYTEYQGIALAPVLLGINRRAVNPVRTTFSEMATYYGNLLPYWAPRNLLFNAFPTSGKALSFALGQLKSKDYATPLVAGVSHFVPNYQKLLKLGTSGIIKEIESYKAKSDDHDFYDSAIIALQGLEKMAQNFADQAREMAAKLEGVDDNRRAELLKIAETCEQVPKYPARTFQQALQAIIFGQIGLICETSQHGVAIGRIDQLLYPYYKEDLKDGRITRDDARELLHLFSIKVSEYVSVMPPVGGKLYGGVNNGQAADFGGRDPVTGKDATNEISYLCAEACGLGMKGPNYHARLHKDSPKDFVDLVAKVLCSGSPIPSIFNEDVIIPTLRHSHPNITDEEIRDFGIVGCCEICPPGFHDTDNALVNIALPLEQTLETNTFTPSCIEDVIESYATNLGQQVKRVVDDVQYLEKGLRDDFPTMLSSALIDGTFESGKDVNAGGAKYNSSGIQGVGLADVCNSLYAIDQAVFIQHLCSWEELIMALRNNFSGREALRAKLLNLPKYGNGNDDVDAFARKVMGLFTAALSSYTNTRGGPYIPGWYSMTTHTHFGKFIGALPSGRKAGTPLANGLSPCSGTERLGPTAALNSSARMDLERTAGNGVIVNLKLHQLLLTGQRGIDTLSGLTRGYFAKGGMQVQFNILDPQELIDALHHPENHRDLIVRISGYAAYFNDLSPEMKQEIIDRTIHLG